MISMNTKILYPYPFEAVQTLHKVSKGEVVVGSVILTQLQVSQVIKYHFLQSN